MANSPTSIETQIDSFLEQFKRSASKAMEERMEWPDGPLPGGVVKSRSSCFTLDSPVGTGIPLYVSHILISRKKV
ncbi:unnamed protein product [Pieris brassicae]|uniref:Uncharacterized protein n=1 Tax=Pieris brassicae TaxID=7116 RepID=A0A9P0T381_PIEBR|nr:unnamed protein product [Pieris brassicae]